MTNLFQELILILVQHVNTMTPIKPSDILSKEQIIEILTFHGVIKEDHETIYEQIQQIIHTSLEHINLWNSKSPE